MNNTPHITIYSTPTCHFCHLAKDYFTEKGIDYTDFNVMEDADKRSEMIEMTGQMGVPVIKIGDDIMVGFNQGKIEELLTAQPVESGSSEEGVII